MRYGCLSVRVGAVYFVVSLEKHKVYDHSYNKQASQIIVSSTDIDRLGESGSQVYHHLPKKRKQNEYNSFLKESCIDIISYSCKYQKSCLKFTI